MCRFGNRQKIPQPRGRLLCLLRSSLEVPPSGKTGETLIHVFAHTLHSRIIGLTCGKTFLHGVLLQRPRLFDQMHSLRCHPIILRNALVHMSKSGPRNPYRFGNISQETFPFLDQFQFCVPTLNYVRSSFKRDFEPLSPMSRGLLHLESINYLLSFLTNTIESSL